MPSNKSLPQPAVYKGLFDESILLFLPERGHWRQLIVNGDIVVCKNHPVAEGEKFITPGDPVVAVKWRSGTRDGLPFWRVFFYCSERCQQSHETKGNFSANIRVVRRQKS